MRTRWSTRLLALSLLGCDATATGSDTEAPTERPAELTNPGQSDPSSDDASSGETSATAGIEWTRGRSTVLPVAEDDVPRIQGIWAQGRYTGSARLDGRLVLVSLRYGKGRDLLDEIDGPATVVVDEAALEDASVVERLQALSERVPLGLALAGDDVGLRDVDLPHVRMLSIDGLFDASRLAPMQKLEYLQVRGTARIDGIPPLPALHTVESVDGLSDAKQIARLPSLREVRLGLVSEFDVAQLHEVEGLEVLYAPNVKLTDADAAALATHASLRELNVGGDLSDGFAAELSDLHQLEELTLHRTQISDVGLAALAKLSSLRVLRLPRSQITDEGVAALAKLPKLREVDFEATAVHGTGLAPLDGLTHVIMRHSKLDSAGLAALAGKPLQVLDVSDTSVSDTGFQKLDLGTLRHLELQGTLVSPAGAAKIVARAPRLEMLDLSGIRVSTLDFLAGLTSLRVLKLAHTRVDDADLEVLTKLEQLRELDLSRTSITDEGLATLREIPRLEEARVRAPGVTDTERTKLRDWLNERR